MTRDQQAFEDYRLEQLADAIQQEKFPNVCTAHPSPHYFDGQKCPACQAESEYTPPLTKKPK